MQPAPSASSAAPSERPNGRSLYQKGLSEHGVHSHDLEFPEHAFGPAKQRITVECTGAAYAKLQKGLHDDRLVVTESSSAEEAEGQAFIHLQQKGAFSTELNEPNVARQVKSVRKSVEPPFLCRGPRALNVDRLLNDLSYVGKCDSKGRVYGLVILTRRSNGRQRNSDPYFIDILSSEPGKKSTDDMFFYREYHYALGPEEGPVERWRALIPPPATTTLAPSFTTTALPESASGPSAPTSLEQHGQEYATTMPESLPASKDFAEPPVSDPIRSLPPRESIAEVDSPIIAGAQDSSAGQGVLVSGHHAQPVHIEELCSEEKRALRWQRNGLEDIIKRKHATLPAPALKPTTTPTIAKQPPSNVLRNDPARTAHQPTATTIPPLSSYPAPTNSQPPQYDHQSRGSFGGPSRNHLSGLSDAGHGTQRASAPTHGYAAPAAPSTWTKVVPRSGDNAIPPTASSQPHSAPQGHSSNFGMVPPGYGTFSWPPSYPGTYPPWSPPAPASAPVPQNHANGSGIPTPGYGHFLPNHPQSNSMAAGAIPSTYPQDSFPNHGTMGNSAAAAPATRSSRQVRLSVPLPLPTVTQSLILALEPDDIKGEHILRLAETMKTEYIKAHVDRMLSAKGEKVLSLSTFTKRITNGLHKRAEAQGRPYEDVRHQFNERRKANGVQTNAAAAQKMATRVASGTTAAVPAVTFDSLAQFFGPQVGPAMHTYNTYMNMGMTIPGASLAGPPAAIQNAFPVKAVTLGLVRDRQEDTKRKRSADDDGSALDKASGGTMAGNHSNDGDGNGHMDKKRSKVGAEEDNGVESGEKGSHE